MSKPIVILKRNIFGLHNYVTASFKKSYTKSLGVALFLFLITALVYAAQSYGLHFLVSLGGIGVVIIEKLIFVFFL